MNDSRAILGPEPLGKRHQVDGFDCGAVPLNQFLAKYALANQAGGSSVTYVICRENRVVGYYTLAPGSVEHESAPARIIKGQARHPVPVILLARLAIDKSEQGQGFGKHLLFDAFRRALAGAEIIGGRALLIDAKDESARRFYCQYDAEESPIDPMQLFILFKDLKKTFS